MLDLKLKTKPLYTAATAVYPYSKDMETHFIVKTKYEPDPIFLTKKMGDFLLVPRELAPLGEDRRSRGKPIAITCTTDFKPDVYAVQKQLHASSLSLLKGGISHTLNALMGIGKTYLASRLICDMGMRTLVIVTKEDLMVQWKGNLLKYTDIKESEIGFIQQDICQVEGKKVVIGLVHSLAGRDYPSNIYDAFGLTVCDEVHRLSAETFSQAMFKFNSYLRLGLSATPVRPDGKSFIFRSHIGEVGSSSDHVQLAPRVLVIRTNWKLPKWRVPDDFGGYKMIPMPIPRGRPAVVSSKMAKDTERNHLLADLCLKAYKKDRNIVMFFDSLNHIEVIKALLISMGIPKGEILRYTGGISEKAAATAHSMRVLLATYSYMSEGTDVPFLDTAILCSPRSNVSQPVGRILRKVPGKKEPVIMDVLDSCAQELIDSFQSRVRQYNKLNATIVDIA